MAFISVETGQLFRAETAVSAAYASAARVFFRPKTTSRWNSTSPK